jgi:hypothetical protein
VSDVSYKWFVQRRILSFLREGIAARESPRRLGRALLECLGRRFDVRPSMGSVGGCYDSENEVSRSAASLTLATNDPCPCVDLSAAFLIGPSGATTGEA